MALAVAQGMILNFCKLDMPQWSLDGGIGKALYGV
jgi:hypothetical protein